MAAANGHHIADPALPDAPAQLTAAVDVIAGHESGPDPQGERAVQQGPASCGWPRTSPPPGPGLLAVLLIRDTRPGQIQRTADQRMPSAGGIGQGHRHLAQRDPAERAAVLAAAPAASAEDFSYQNNGKDRTMIADNISDIQASA